MRLLFLKLRIRESSSVSLMIVADIATQDKMAQCPDAHLFCVSCLTAYVEARVGEANLDMVCMDTSGCKLLFSETELARVLNAKLLSLYNRMKQVKEVEAAGLDGLESCPFCDYKVVIENAAEKLLRCQNEDCMTITCRECKKAVSSSSQSPSVFARSYCSSRIISQRAVRVSRYNCDKVKYG